MANQLTLTDFCARHELTAKQGHGDVKTMLVKGLHHLTWAELHNLLDYQVISSSEPCATGNVVFLKPRAGRLVKTLDNGNKVFSIVEMEVSPHSWDNGARLAVGYHVELNANGEQVKKWRPGFEELAGHSPAGKKVGH